MKRCPERVFGFGLERVSARVRVWVGVRVLVRVRVVTSGCLLLLRVSHHRRTNHT